MYMCIYLHMCVCKHIMSSCICVYMYISYPPIYVYHIHSLPHTPRSTWRGGTQLPTISPLFPPLCPVDGRLGHGHRGAAIQWAGHPRRPLQTAVPPAQQGMHHQNAASASCKKFEIEVSYRYRNVCPSLLISRCTQFCLYKYLLCVCVYICMFVFMYIYTFIYIYMYFYIYIYIHIYIYIYMYIYTYMGGLEHYTSVHTTMHVCYIYIHVCICMCSHVCLGTYVHTCSSKEHTHTPFTTF